MVAVLLTAIAVIGIVGLYRVQTRSSGYSRRSTEASVLASDMMEKLRTTDDPCGGGLTSCTGSQANVTPSGTVGGGPFQRTWAVSQPTATQWRLEVNVTWDDDGTPRTVKLYSLRSL